MAFLSDIRTECEAFESPVSSLYREYIYKVFTDDPYVTVENENLYVSFRTSFQSEMRKSAHINYFKNFDISFEELDLQEEELTLLKFVYDPKYENAVLLLIGGIGVGKSTIVYYCFRKIINQIPALSSIIPIILDCRTLESIDPEISFSRRLKQAWQDSKILKKKVEEYLPDKLESFNKKIFQEVQSKSEAIEIRDAFGRLLRDLKGRDLKPVIIFDNTDHVNSKSRKFVRETARVYNLTDSIPCIIPIRPDTLVSIDESFSIGEAFIGYSLEIGRPDLGRVIHGRFEKVKRDILKQNESDPTDPIVLKSGKKIYVTKEEIIKFFERASLIISETSLIDFFWKLGNYNLREVLMIIARFIRYDENISKMLVSSKETFIEFLEEDNLSTAAVIRSEMFSGGPLYKYNNSATSRVVNMFHDSNIRNLKTITKYYVLCYLWCGSGPVYVEELYPVIRVLESMVDPKRIVSFLVKQKLISVIEYKSKLYDIESDEEPIIVDISPMGRLHLTEIIRNRQYLLNVVTDVNIIDESILEEARITDPTHYAVKIQGCLYLLEKIYEQELDMISELIEGKHYCILKRVSEIGMLSIVMYETFKKSYREKIRIQSLRIHKIHKQLNPKIQELGTKINELSRSYVFIKKSISKETINLQNVPLDSERKISVYLNKSMKNDKLISLDITIHGYKDSKDVGMVTCVYSVFGKNIEQFYYTEVFKPLDSKRLFCQLPISICFDPLKIKEMVSDCDIENIIDEYIIHIYTNGVISAELRYDRSKGESDCSGIDPDALYGKNSIPSSDYILSVVYDQVRQTLDFTTSTHSSILETTKTRPIVSVSKSIGDIRIACRKALKKHDETVLAIQEKELHDLKRKAKANGRNLAKMIFPPKVTSSLDYAIQRYDNIQILSNLSCFPWELTYMGDLRDGCFLAPFCRNCNTTITRLRFPKRKSEPILFNMNRIQSTQRSEVNLILGSVDSDINKTSLRENKIVGLKKLGVNVIENLKTSRLFDDALESSKRLYIVAHNENNSLKFSDELEIPADELMIQPFRGDLLFMGSCNAAVSKACIDENSYDCLNQDFLCQEFLQRADNIVIASIGLTYQSAVLEMIGIIENELITSRNARTFRDVWKTVRNEFENRFFHWLFFAFWGSWNKVIFSEGVYDED